MKSWKIGAIAGIFAGIIFVVLSEIFLKIGLSIGLWDAWWRQYFVGNTIVNIPLFIFWGIVLGVIYSKVHDLIPGKGILKGLVYGLFFFLILPIRNETFMIPYGAVLNAIGNLFSAIFVWPVFGLSLGIFYKLLHDRYLPTKGKSIIVTYDMKSGLLPGAIAGIMQGIAAGFVSVIGHLTGQWGVPVGGEIISTIEYWISQFGTHILINMIWATIFGAFFALVYNLVPGKKIMKGVCYALIMFLITSGQWFSWVLVAGANHDAWQLVNIQIINYFVYGFDFVVFGLVLGLLYRKPPK